MLVPGLPLGAYAQQQVLPAQSEIAFVSRQLGVPVEGKFRKWTAQLSFDPKKAETSRIEFSIDTGSATMGAADVDAEIVKAEWFGASRFPAATFSSTATRALGGGRFEVRGKLTIKGQSQEVLVPVALSQTGSTGGSAGTLQTTATGQFSIKRLAFRIGEGAWSDTSMVADEVQVRFKLQLSGIAPL